MLRRLALFASTLTGVPLVAGWLITTGMLHPKPRVEDNSLENMPLPAEDLSFLSRDGTRLSGWFIPAPDRGPAPGIVLSHGWARSRCELLPHARFLHQAGFATLMFDYRHRGKSDGSEITMGLREQDDLIGALDVISTRPEVDPERIGLLGMSMGGAIAILVAARDRRVRALVCEAPFPSFDTILERSLRHYAKLPGFLFGPITKFVLERRLNGSMDTVAPARAAPSLSPRPLFIMADERDAVIGADETARVFEAASEPKRFWLIEGSDHARGWQTAPEEYERRVLDFFRQALKATAAARTDAAS
jgi:dipeptidyl aminopeptidase/acylaminoacyl peptidase